MSFSRKTTRFGVALCLSFNVVALQTSDSLAITARAAAQPALDPPEAPAQHRDTLRFYNLHTGERLTITRREGEALTRQANWFMRDFRRGETARMDPELIDLLGDIQREIRRRHPGMKVEFHVISPYRAPATNDSLRSQGGGQAQNSLHTRGRAIDISVPGLSTRELRNIATCLGVGGVGYYQTDGFVHVDTGRVRYWPSRAYVSGLKCD